MRSSIHTNSGISASESQNIIGLMKELGFCKRRMRCPSPYLHPQLRIGFQPGVCQETWTPSTSSDILMIYFFFSNYDSCLVIDKLKYPCAFSISKTRRFMVANTQRIFRQKPLNWPLRRRRHSKFGSISIYRNGANVSHSPT